MVIKQTKKEIEKENNMVYKMWLREQLKKDYEMLIRFENNNDNT